MSVDHGCRRVTGKLTRDTLAANPVPVVKTDLSGTTTIAGTIRVTSAHDYAIDGYVQTSHGRIATSVAGSLEFANYQRYANVTELTEDLAVAQTTTAKTTVTTRNAHGTFVHRGAIAFPVSVSLDFAIDPTVTGAQKTKVDQHFTQADAEFGPSAFEGSFASNEVTSADTLDLANGSISGNAGQKSAQTYFAYDTNAGCYAKVLAAANNVLTRADRLTCDAGAAFATLRAMLTGPN